MMSTSIINEGIDQQSYTVSGTISEAIEAGHELHAIYKPKECFRQTLLPAEQGSIVWLTLIRRVEQGICSVNCSSSVAR